MVADVTTSSALPTDGAAALGPAHHRAMAAAYEMLRHEFPDRFEANYFEALATEIDPADQREADDLARVIEATALVFGVTPDALTGSHRKRQLVDARHAAMWVARQVTPLSFAGIALGFGGRDHSAVQHAVRRVDDLVAGGDQRTMRRLAQIQRRLEVVGLMAGGKASPDSVASDAAAG